MAANGTLLSENSAEISNDEDQRDDNGVNNGYQGPHDWRKRLKPVKSPIKDEPPEFLLNGETKEFNESTRTKSRPLPPWKRDLIERNKKVARLVRRESSGRSKVVRRESSGRSKKGSESPSSCGIGRKKSFRGGQPGAENTFTQQVVNETSGLRRRISPANSFKSASGVRRTPSDKCLDPNDPHTKKRVERVRRARLYLLQQMGPNSFQIVGDSPEHKFKVIIGPQTCNCGRGPHCAHLLFVMLRVFQVSETDPCLWTRQLKNYEVENLFRVYNDKRILRIEAKKLKRNQKSNIDRSTTPSPEESLPPSESDAGSVREEDDTCPICLLEMLEGESLLRCDGCQNRLHHHCITVWFDECKRQCEPLICPLCRSRWKKAGSEVKIEDAPTVAVTDPPLVPPNTRAPSPQHDVEPSRLPYAEPIPGEYINMATPWMELLGEDLVSCLFSRNWSIRETGMKHLSREMARELSKVTGESRSGMSLTNTETMFKLLGCCFNVVAFISQDPVYKVFVGCLKVLRAVFAVTPSRDYAQRTKLQALFRPVVDAIVVKCTDGNRRTSQLSISTLLELAKGQHGELSVGKDLANPGTLGLGGMSYLVRILTEKYDSTEVSWQWLLGRLYIIEKLIVEFPTEFLPRQRPDGASSESSLELIGATSGEEEERPQNYDRLLVVAEFTMKAVSNRHQRISRVAKRVFLLAARYAAHLENLIAEFESLLAELEYSHKKSLRRQLDKIVADFALSEKLGRQLLHANDNFSVDDSPTETPVSSPRCTSPSTTVSDLQSEAGPNSEKAHPVVPPNTPIRDRRQHLKGDKARKSFDLVQEETIQDKRKRRMRASKSLDNLDISGDSKAFTLPSKTPAAKAKATRTRSNTPQRIGPVLETNLDEIIQLEETKKSNTSKERLDEIHNTSTVQMDLSLGPSELLQTSPADKGPFSPLPLLSHDLETDIDTVEPNIDILHMTKPAGFSTQDCNGASNSYRNPKSLFTQSVETPKMKHKIPKSLSLDLDNEVVRRRSRRSVSPCAFVDELNRMSSGQGVFQTPCQNSLSQSKSLLPTATLINTASNATEQLVCEDGASSSASSRKTCKSKDCTQGRKFSVFDETIKHPSRSEHTDDLLKYMATTPCTGNEKPVTFKSEVAMGTPKHSPSHTLDKDDDDCHCKEEVEKEEALALAKAMELSCKDPPKPFVPGLTPMDQEEVITIRIQPDECGDMDQTGNYPTLYYESVHWLKGHLLGTGAFSTCYQARDVETGTIMALKQISFCRNSKSEQENVIETITEEIHMMAKLNHPHIVRILGATRQGCHFNMFVEWMPGGSVSYLLGQYGAFSEEVITSYVLQILRGLTYLHENHILHRDLKGANLLVDSTGHRLRIGDFGAAARLASKATGAGEFQGQLLGTIAFMAPEVLRGENYGRACDVWSVGCCLIEMATTKPPWNANDISNHLALIFKIANSQSSPPIPEKLSPPLRDVLLRCLEHVKEDRPTAKELLIHPLFTQYMQKKKNAIT